MKTIMQTAHVGLVMRLVKPGDEILRGMNAYKMNILHAAIGISGEAGELLDAAKKAAIYNKSLDRDNIIEELGDLEFYMEQLRQAIGVERDEVLRLNIAKLEKRYPSGYTDQAAQQRADKA